MQSYRKSRVPRKWTVAERLARYSRPASSGCILWTARLTASGYGVLSWAGKNRRAHRLAWENAKGPIPVGLCVCHTCDTRHCVNVDHLFLGTHKDNAVDRNSKGRQAKGLSLRFATGKAKLTPEQVKEILSTKKRKHGIAARFGISRAQVGRIRRGECWGDG